MLMFDDELLHEGRDKEHTSVPNGPGSGRFPKGSGENPYQHGNQSLSSSIDALRKQGWKDKDIAEVMGYKSNKELQQAYSIDKDREKVKQISVAQKYYDEGMSYSEIGRVLGKNESVIRTWLSPGYIDKFRKTENTANVLKEMLKEKKYLDVGKGAEIELGVKDERLDKALQMLQDEGYGLHSIKVPQITQPGQYTWMTILTEPDVSYSEVRQNQDKIQGVGDWSTDNGGDTFRHIQFPESIDHNRVMVRFNEEGGAEKDGVIELRRGVADLSLGDSMYSQVRIAVDGTHYMKGMAVYGDDSEFPDGVDVIYNSHRSVGTPLFNKDETHSETVFKAMKKDKTTGEIDEFNPFGATIKAKGQSMYIGEDGKEHLSLINKVNEEGDWGEWGKRLSAQFLSKQSLPLIQRQLNASYLEKVDELDEINKLTLPEVKKYYLEKFASECDSGAEHLKAVPFPGQGAHVIIPVDSLKDNEVYAPNYKNGEKVVLVRYPHAGVFEIPELVVNNNNKEGVSVLGKNPMDAIGINSRVAAQLSGADFDGDTVTVIPVSSKVKITTKKPLDELKDFDPQEAYAAYPGMPKSDADHGFYKQRQMGEVSNLITDMTLKGADYSEIARAVKHSMVVIDAEKHNLNWRQSFEDNRIAELKKEYQGGERAGASTIVSKSKSEYRDHMRKEYSGLSERNVDPETGEKIVTYSPEFYTDKNGKTQERFYTTTKMDMTKDAMTLVSDVNNPKEVAYADYANSLKALANTARKEYLATGSTKKSPSSAEAYKEEVGSLMAKLNDAEKNAPKERLAQLRANQVWKAKRDANPNMEKDEAKKIKQQALTAAREAVGTVSRKDRFAKITDREWQAIMSGAVSSNVITRILTNADPDTLRSLAMPKETKTISDAKAARIKAYAASGYTQAEIAEKVGISTSSVSKVLHS